MADATIDLLKNSSYVGKMDELIAAVKLGGSATSDVEWNNVKNKPTTIAGYGITDAKIENGTITLGNQTITPLTSAPVTSVNSKTGDVTLSATDVSAIPSTLTGTAGQVLTKTADGQEWKDVNIPDKLPNPNALTFTGAVTGSYDGSAPLEVEIPSGGGQVFANDLLAEGTIASGLAAWSAVDTGLTVGDLRTYKSFIILITGTISGGIYYDFGTNVGGARNAVRFEWEDDAKTILMCDGHSSYTDLFSNKYNADIVYWGADRPWIRFDFRNVADSRSVRLTNASETSSECAYKIMGWMK